VILENYISHPPIKAPLSNWVWKIL
jgi:hypothetical protein